MVKIIIGAVLLIIGIAIIPSIYIGPLVAGPSEEVVFEAPGSAELKVLAPGRFYLWHRYETVFDGESLSRPERLPEGMRIDIRRSNGQQLQLERDASISRESNGEQSRSIGFVDLAAPGNVEIEVTDGGGAEHVLAFARFRIWEIVRAIGLALASILIIGGMGLFLLTWGVAQRAKS